MLCAPPPFLCITHTESASCLHAQKGSNIFVSRNYWAVFGLLVHHCWERQDASKWSLQAVTLTNTETHLQEKSIFVLCNNTSQCQLRKDHRKHKWQIISFRKKNTPTTNEVRIKYETADEPLVHPEEPCHGQLICFPLKERFSNMVHWSNQLWLPSKRRSKRKAQRQNLNNSGRTKNKAFRTIGRLREEQIIVHLCLYQLYHDNKTLISVPFLECFVLKITSGALHKATQKETTANTPGGNGSPDRAYMCVLSWLGPPALDDGVKSWKLLLVAAVDTLRWRSFLNAVLKSLLIQA